MYDIESYFEAQTINEAIELLKKDPELVVIAGGTDVLINMYHDKIENARLLSIRNIKDLARIDKLDDGTIKIGSLVTFTQLAKDPVIKEHIPVLVQAALSMGGPQIRNVATIGGNICNGATSADSASTLFALNASLKLQSAAGERILPIQDFYLGPGKVQLKPGEILTEILIAPKNYEGYVGRYIKFSMRKAMDIATLGVSAICKINNNVFEDVRIGLGVAAPTPIRCKEAEEYAKGKTISDETISEIGKLAVKSTKARTSWRASKEYREHLVQELTRRALKEVVAAAGGEGSD